MSSSSGNRVVHLELHTGNLPRACDFYTRLFAWRAEAVRVGSAAYLALDLGGGIEGGVVERQMRCPLWLPYVEVADVTAATERAHRLGAAVALEPREGPAGWRSVVTSRAGGAVALWQLKRDP